MHERYTYLDIHMHILTRARSEAMHTCTHRHTAHLGLFMRIYSHGDTAMHIGTCIFLTYTYTYTHIHRSTLVHAYTIQTHRRTYAETYTHSRAHASRHTRVTGMGLGMKGPPHACGRNLRAVDADTEKGSVGGCGMHLVGARRALTAD